MKSDRSDWGINTKINHPQMVKLLPGNSPLLQPIYQSAKFTPSEDYPYSDQYIYSRISNPTLRQLEQALAEIQNKEDCIVMASGIAAITGTFLALLKAGDHIITFREIYKPARVFIQEFLPRFQIQCTTLSLYNLEAIEQSIIPGKTKLIHFETPSNPNLDIADIEKIIHIARKHNFLVCMDGTFAGIHQHNEFDIDLVIQSLTKYVNGHGDVIAGSVAGKKSLIQTIKNMSGYLGATLDPHAANLITRGLKTYLIRYEKQCQSALTVAEFLSSHPKIEKVLYPGLSSHPGHDLAVKQMKDMGAVVAFEIKADLMTAEKFCHQLKLIQFTASLGSTESIICPTQLFFGMDLHASDRAEMGINLHSLRLSVGLEDPKDIIKDLSEVLG
jgi:cystathionine beta-lyase/cystathionine gamma-synthase